MYKIYIAFAIFFVAARITATSCSVVNDVKITFYGYQPADNTPPRSSIKYSCPFIEATNNRSAIGLNKTLIQNIPESGKPTRSQFVINGNHRNKNACDPTSNTNRNCTHQRSIGQYSYRNTLKDNKRGNKLQRRVQLAGGTGSYNDPLTMASSSVLFNICEIFYVPYLQKYVRFEDHCKDCDTAVTSGVHHINIWTGSNSVSGGFDQIGCEMALSPGGEQSIIRSPSTNLTVNGQ